MELVAWVFIGLILAYCATIDAVYKYKLKRCTEYNDGYKKGYDDTLKYAMDNARKSNKDICEKFKAQFTAKKSYFDEPKEIKVDIGGHPLKMYDIKHFLYKFSRSSTKFVQLIIFCSCCHKMPR